MWEARAVRAGLSSREGLAGSVRGVAHWRSSYRRPVSWAHKVTVLRDTSTLTIRPCMCFAARRAATGFGSAAQNRAWSTMLFHPRKNAIPTPSSFDQSASGSVPSAFWSSATRRWAPHRPVYGHRRPRATNERGSRRRGSSGGSPTHPQTATSSTCLVVLRCSLASRGSA